MKTCSKCGISKEETDFFIKEKTKNRLHAQCKDCYKIHRRTYYKDHYSKYKKEYLLRAKLRAGKLRSEFRNNMLSYLDDKYCLDCGESDIRVLEFDHINPNQKLFSISQAVYHGYGWEKTLEEIRKCRILCANCHKKRTSMQFNWYKER